MKRQRLLFVCTANRHRSRTAEDLYRDNPDYDVLSAGTDTLRNDPEERPVTRELVDWADLIFAMEQYHRSVLAERFPGCEAKTVVLGIPDRYYRDDPELIELLQRRIPRHLPEHKNQAG